MHWSAGSAGLVKATRWAYDNKVEFIAATRKHLPTGAEELGKIYDQYLEAHVWAINGELDPKRLAYMQELGLKTKTQTRTVNLDTLFAFDVTVRATQSIGRREYPLQR